MLRTFILTLALALPIGTAAMAQDYDWRSVLSRSVKVQMKVNLQYEFSKKRSVPIHFTMGIPFSADDLITRTRFPEEHGNLGEVMFVSPDEQLLEYVTVSVGTVGGDTQEDRMKRIFAMIDRQVYPSLTAPPNAKVLGGRHTEISGHPAVEFVSLFDNPDQGSVAARIVGVLAPNQTDVVFLVQQSMYKHLDLTGPDELANTFGGAMLSSLTFQAYRDASGKLVKFE